MHVAILHKFFFLQTMQKLFKHVRSAEDSAVLQRSCDVLQSCDRLFQWSNQWLLKLNVDKCKVLSIGLRDTTDFTYYLGDDNDRIELERASSMKDLGVIIDCKLKFQDHIKQKINKAYSMLGILRRNEWQLNPALWTKHLRIVYVLHRDIY